MEKSRSLKRTKSGLEYIEMLTHYFTANDIDFIQCFCRQNVQVNSEPRSTDKPDSKMFKDLVGRASSKSSESKTFGDFTSI